MRAIFFAVLIGLAPSAVCAADTDPYTEMLARAQTAWLKGEKKAALELVSAAIKVEPKKVQAYQLRSVMRASQGEFAEAVADLDRCSELDPKNAEVYQRRGMVQFQRGKFKESVADFDREIELKPERGPGHWMRGISLYYAGRYADGKKQFDAYQKTDSNDVENAVWHFLCAAKADGIEKARAGMLKIGKDRRVPMTEIYDLYADKLKPEDVLKAAGAGKTTEDEARRQLFYAHLYLGIYADVLGDKKKAEEHLALAAGKYKIGHYMGEVARIARNTVSSAKK
jgi:lipoprotein NlpI